MPTSMEHGIRIAVTGKQMDEAKGVRGETPSRELGLTVAQSQNGNNYRGRGKGHWGYNKRLENGPRLGPRDQRFSRRG